MCKSIGERIKKRREQLGMSQEELALKLGYKSRSSVNKIEVGERNLTQSKIKAIADALETSVNYIMGWEMEEPKTEQQYYYNEDARELIEFMAEHPEYGTLFKAVRNVPAKDIEFVKDFIDRIK